MILFDLDYTGKVKFFKYAITNGEQNILCETESKANNLINNPRYSAKGYAVIESDEVPEALERAIEGVRFDSKSSANYFINESGYTESIRARVEDLEIVIAELFGGEA